MPEDAYHPRPRTSGRRGTTSAAAAAGALLLLAALAAGCGQAPDGGPPASSASAAAPSAAPGGAESGSAGQRDTETLPRSAPDGLEIPAIGVDTSETVALGTRDNGKIQVPEGDHTVGWYDGGPTPGEFGPALMGAHVDSDSGPALFYRLADLDSGDEVRVRRQDGTTAVFTVYAVEQYAKSAFPTRKVYAPTENRAELRLVTCGGTFDGDSGHYRDNTVVYARMSGVA
ncbi:class F sortase [Streptomonospora wellingtoniae]|uniref:Class F sortase n=1 Tax=Streptomonospora wellingtoniae TaxID=3075544 RepID=A0ABU2KNT3_9ACTN|nr:class F sortase [Streptomonospora sp. DSM 45055]MDT0300924.1 class F sortase [Streptomonospora sp. DSM 45055]